MFREVNGEWQCFNEYVLKTRGNIKHRIEDILVILYKELITNSIK